MSQIDYTSPEFWAKAPEGATHWAPETDDYHACWYKDGYWAYANSSSVWKRETKKISAERAAQMVPRPAEHTPWDGTGRPPAGIPLEMKHKKATKEWARPDFYVATLAWVGERRFVVAGDETVGDLGDYLFRPIRTPEQIAAEAREKAIKAMLDLRSFGAGVEEFAQQLYDAGYRKVEGGAE